MELSHVAIFVPTLEGALNVLESEKYPLGEIELFDSKNDGKTREIYLGPKEGWYLHTASADGLINLQTVYLVRPNFPLIIEVHSAINHQSLSNYFVHKIQVQVNNLEEEKAICSLGIPDLEPTKSHSSKNIITIGERLWDIQKFV